MRREGQEKKLAREKGFVTGNEDLNTNTIRTKLGPNTPSQSISISYHLDPLHTRIF